MSFDPAIIAAGSETKSEKMDFVEPELAMCEEKNNLIKTVLIR